MNTVFRDRRDAGRALAATLLTDSNVTREPVVLALSKGGVPVAFEVAERFPAPLDVCIVDRLEVPGSSGVVMGAVASHGIVLVLSSVVQSMHVTEKDVARVVRRQSRDLKRRERAYRGERAPASVGGRTVILVDDGLTSLATPTTAIAAIRTLAPERVVFATPVAKLDSSCGLRNVVDDLICLQTPVPFRSVSEWYSDFSPVSDLEVRSLHGAACARTAHWSFTN